MTKSLLILHAYAELISHDLFMSRHDFASLHRRVRGFPICATKDGANSAASIAFALNVACCFYPKRVLCLQRSAVMVKILREKGLPARLVIGAQKLPFKAHAWVELDGVIIDDRLASREKFFILEEC
jgi:hypothetical protein